MTKKGWEREYSFLNRDIIKYIAMFTMLLNHAALIFLREGTLLYEVLKDVGYFTAITMCYFLVEGYHYTRSKKRYGRRLALFALISELPYCLAFTKGGVISYDGLNVIVNLFLCFLLIYVCDTMQNDSRRPFLVALLFLGSLFCDWSFFAPVFTLLFAGAREEGTKAALKDAYGKSILLFGMYNLLDVMMRYPPVQGSGCAFGIGLLRAAGTILGPVVSAFCIIYGYNGKRGKRFAGFSKWFFYLFYPLHLLILGLIRVQMGL